MAKLTSIDTNDFGKEYGRDVNGRLHPIHHTAPIVRVKAHTDEAQYTHRSTGFGIGWLGADDVEIPLDESDIACARAGSVPYWRS